MHVIMRMLSVLNEYHSYMMMIGDHEDDEDHVIMVVTTLPYFSFHSSLSRYDDVFDTENAGYDDDL